MSGPLKGGLNQITSIHSAKPLELEDHEIDLQAVTSNPVSISEVGTSLTDHQKFIILQRVHMDGLVSLDNLPPTAAFYIQKVENITEDESIAILKEAVVDLRDDSNIPTPDYVFLEKLISSANEKTSHVHQKLQSTIEHSQSFEGINFEGDIRKIVDWSLQVRLEAVLIAYHSPYPQVRAITDPFDDPSIPVETVRVYIAGVVWTAIGAVVNQFFEERLPNITLSPAIVQIFLYPTGLLLETILPKWKFTIWNQSIDLNPGPWSRKEQMLATLFYSVSGGGASYASSILHVYKMERFYNSQWADFGFQTLLVLSNNFLGFGFAGVFRKFAVYPVEAIWPTVLPTIALNRALMVPEKREVINGWRLSKYVFFFIVFGTSFLYFWIPDYLFQALSTFNWMTWIKPDNFHLAAITGSIGGLGLNPIPTFDWNVLNEFTNCLAIPFFTSLTTYIGGIISMFCIIGVYYTNYKWTSYLPINTNSLFTNTGEPYAVTTVLNEQGLLDNKKYQNYGPPFYSASNLVAYGAFFAIYPFAIVYEIGNRYKQMWKAFKGVAIGLKNIRTSSLEGYNDPHSKMMTAYKEVPDWVFLVVLVISLVLAIVCVEIYPVETPVWGLFFALGINFVFLIPITAVYSRTGWGFGLNVLVELITGYALPGNGLALMFIKAFGYNIDGQAQNYITDQKMAHYAKIPPRALFRGQILSVFIASFVQLGILNFVIGNVTDYCDPHNKQRFTCANARTQYSASILWGVIGPKKVFNGLYPILQYCFLIGFLAAIPCLAIKWYGPRKYTKYFEPTLVIGGFLNWAPVNLTYYTGGLYVSFAFMYYIKRRFEGWWQKYNYILSAGLSAGVAFASIIIFFAVQYHDKSISWWGNNVINEGIDGGFGRQSLLNATESAQDGYFGPRVGHFP
ncbi:OPT oligopeptide transporter protein-domain-containing protein [Scheffersomyces xylosifermentans]|uniref:OPT oligopeptide transporter protein-domain-containing protein n=1 Tax=Scheffersomyces xylosifermentans TaxID=1304137 RepID=UPI00315CEE90